MDNERPRLKKRVWTFLGPLGSAFVLGVGLNWHPLVWVVREVVLAPLCKHKGGKWAPAQNVCVTRDCVRAHTCLSHYDNGPTCRELQGWSTTSPVSGEQLIFEMGEPTMRNGGTLTFGGQSIVEVDLGADGLAKSFRCPP